MKPSQKAIDAAYSMLPYNDLLYGDTTKALSEEELIQILETAYTIDFPERNEDAANRRS